ncbi:hypothetical protein C0995_002177 [Termitomyces sp. Mi166|nr:hypothetical protein C0995_002177 [Termitomyces sp. Mi166\
MYWDVMDNLFDLVSVDGQAIKRAEGFAICDFIQSNLIDENGRPRQPIPQDQIYRLQNVAYTRAFVMQAGSGNTTQQPPDNYSHVVNLALLTPHFAGTEQLSLRDLIVATCITGLFFMGTVPQKILALLGLRSMTQAYESNLDILRAVHVLGNDLIVALHEVGFDSLPVILLDPVQVTQLPIILFRAFHHVLPSNCSMDLMGNPILLPETIRNFTNQITSQALLMIAKYFQDALGGANIADGTFQSCRISAPLAMILYYLALALSPSAIACNNLGALMSTNMSTILPHNKGQKMVDTDIIKMAFYQHGLQLVPDHPHLLTNLGSTLREKGDIPNAISLYMRAIEIDPHLDSALVNIASAFRDVGRPWDSVTFYRQVREPSPDVVCGLASALSAICDWRDRGWLKSELRMLQTLRSSPPYGEDNPGWIHELVSACDAQLQSVYAQNIGLMRKTNSLQEWLRYVTLVYSDMPLLQTQWKKWERRIGLFFTDFDRPEQCVNEGGFLIRLVDWLLRGLQRRWYNEEYGRLVQSEESKRCQASQNERYLRPLIPNVGHFPIPSLQPFHTFSFHLEPRMIRLISHRNALRVSYRALTQPWLPRHVYPPPPPPHIGRLNIGYVSYDFINHPLAHLVQSVFGFHNPSRFNVHTYATSPDDGSSYRQKIANDSHVFIDISSWSLEAILNRIMTDQIHIRNNSVINLGGFTRGANNEIFAARLCPVQILMMGFPGSCGAGWCDYLLGDVIACPPSMRSKTTPREDGLSLDINAEPDPESSEDWIFTEKMIYMPHTFMATDHLQFFGRTPQLSFEEEEIERNRKRIVIFPGVAPFLYKIDPNKTIFWVWLSILRRVPQSILWLLRFPSAGEEHLKRTATAWAGEAVANRIHFTDVAPKEEHVRRGTVADLFLDTAEVYE